MSNNQNQDDASLRFSLLELDNVPIPKVVTKPVPTAGVDIIPEAKEKADSEVKLAEQAGFKVPDALFDNGTAMLEGTDGDTWGGWKGAIAHRKEWEKRTLVKDGADQIEKIIASEERADVIRNLSDYRFDNDGIFRRIGNGGLRVTKTSWTQLGMRAPKDAAITANMNSWLAKGPSVTLRTRNPKDNTRELYAVVSKKYAKFDVDQLARMVSEEIGGDARMEFSYDPGNTRISMDVSLMNPYDIPGEIGVGRMHRVGMRITSADNGMESIRVRLYAERIACINCTILRAESLKGTRKHYGAVDKVRAQVAEMIGQCDTAMSAFADLWSEANERAIVDAYDGTPLSAEESFKRLIATGRVESIPGNSIEKLDLLMGAWNREPGDVSAAVQRAITRAAHTNNWSTWVADEIEEQASELLYAKVYELPGLTDEQMKQFSVEDSESSESDDANW